MENDNLNRRKMIIAIGKWSLAGLFIRVLIMPFTMHFDLFVIDYVADIFARYGKWAFDLRIMSFYFPPMVYILKTPFIGLAHLFSPDIGTWLESGKPFFHNARPYDHWLMFLLDIDKWNTLFRNLFLLKLCQLVCDFAIGLLLISIVRDRGKAMLVFKLWMLNPVVLHSAFAHGGIDILPTLFMVAALYFAFKGNRLWALLLLLLGGMTKVFPLLIVIPYILVAENSFTKRLRLCGIVVIIFATLGLILHLIIGVNLAGILKGPGPMMADISTSPVNLARKVGFISFYGLFLLHLFFRKQKVVSLQNYLTVFIVPILILFTFQPIGFRYWIWISPLVVLHLAQNRSHWPVWAVHLLSLFVLRVCAQPSLQLGILRPLYPEYFSLIPGYTSVVEGIIPEFWLLRSMNILFIITSFVLLWSIWLEVFKGWNPFKHLDAIYRYGLYCMIAGLVLLFFAGTGNLDQRGEFKGKEFFITGYRNAPDTLISLPEKENLIDQTIPSPGHRFSTVGVWFEYDSITVANDTIIASLSFSAGDSVVVRMEKTAVAKLENRSYHLFHFGEIPLAEGFPVKLGIEKKGEGSPSGLKVGLISHRGKPRVIVGKWQDPRRTPSGGVELVTPRAEPLDYRLSSSTIYPDWQMALSFYSEVPTDHIRAGKIILDRLKTDRPFIIFYLCMLGLLFFGIVIMVVWDRDR